MQFQCRAVIERAYCVCCRDCRRALAPTHHRSLTVLIDREVCRAYACAHTCITHTHLRVCVCVCPCASACVCAFVYLCACFFRNRKKHTRIQTSTHTCTRTYTYVYRHIHRLCMCLYMYVAARWLRFFGGLRSCRGPRVRGLACGQLCLVINTLYHHLPPPPPPPPPPSLTRRAASRGVGMRFFVV
jgi:hypothetical protein